MTATLRSDARRARRFVFRCADDVFQSEPFTLDADRLGRPIGLDEAAQAFAEHVHGEHGDSGQYEVVPLDPPVSS